MPTVARVLIAIHMKAVLAADLVEGGEDLSCSLAWGSRFWASSRVPSSRSLSFLGAP